MNELGRFLVPALLMAAGAFSAVCSLREYRFFWEHRRARFMIRILGRAGAKIFYFTLGVALFTAGAAFAITGVPL